jgi:hypothetical protein
LIIIEADDSSQFTKEEHRFCRNGSWPDDFSTFHLVALNDQGKVVFEKKFARNCSLASHGQTEGNPLHTKGGFVASLKFA